MKPQLLWKYIPSEGAGKPRRPENGCFAALALKYTWRYIYVYAFFPSEARASKYGPSLISCTWKRMLRCARTEIHLAVYMCIFSADPSIKICPLSGKIPFRCKCSDFIEINFKMIAVVSGSRKINSYMPSRPQAPGNGSFLKDHARCARTKIHLVWYTIFSAWPQYQFMPGS